MVARLSECIFPDSNWPGEYCFVRSPKKVVLLKKKKKSHPHAPKCELTLLAQFRFVRKKA